MSAQKNTIVKLSVVSEIIGVKLNTLVHTTQENGIEEHGFYE